MLGWWPPSLIVSHLAQRPYSIISLHVWSRSANVPEIGTKSLCELLTACIWLFLWADRCRILLVQVCFQIPRMYSSLVALWRVFFLWADLAVIMNIFIFQNNTVNNIFLADKQMKIHMIQKPKFSRNFTGRKDILDKLGKIFAPRTDIRQMSRRSCLLWGLDRKSVV